MKPLLTALGGLAAASLLHGGEARAEDCSTLPNVLYLQVGDTQEPLMKALGQKLRDNTANPITLVYALAGSCPNIEAMYSDVKLVTSPFYIPPVAEDATWDPTKTAPTCTLPAGGVSLDVTVSATFVDSCTTDPPPAGVKLFTGPIQPYAFVVPYGTPQKAITAEEAYFVFGFGTAGGIAPWTEESQLFIRPPSKSTILTMAGAIDVRANKWKGIPFDKSGQVLTALTTTLTPEKALGILGVEIADGKRDVVTELAFQGYKQRHAYWPDSKAGGNDKKNVRDGHYLPWAPTVYMTHVDGSGVPTNAKARYVIDMVTSKDPAPAPSFDPLATQIGVSLIPDCAMHVSREFEGGDLSLYSSTEPCDCFYETQAAKGKVPDGCVSCESTPCKTGVCRHGFCEAR